MKKEKQQIIETIQKMLLLAVDQDGTPEGENAKRHAALMMAKYRIQETEVDLETDNFILDRFTYDYDGPDVPQWVGRLVGVFCQCFDTETVFRAKFQGKEWEIIGTFSDVETTKYFINIASHHIMQAGWNLWKNDKNWRKRQQLGNEAVDVLWKRVWELKEQMDSTIHADENCSALVVQKEAEIKEAIEEMYPNLKTAKNKKIDRAMDEKTKNAGKNAGETCPLNYGIET